MINIQNFKDYTEILIHWLTFVAVILGGTWTLYQYSEHRYEGRVKETLDYVKQYDEGVLRDARNKVYEMWQNVDEEYKKILLDKSISDNEFTDFVVKIILKNNTSASILDILDFFERLAICVNTKLCDKNTAILYMRRHLQEFWRQNYPFIKYIRIEYENSLIGKETESLYNATL